MMITDYDVFGRVTQTGWKAMTVTESDRGNWQNNINGGGNPFTLTANDILTKNYYDNYSFTGGPSPVPTTNVRGLATGSWVRVITTPTDLNGEISYTLYDNKYRPVRSYTKNYLGGYTQVDSQLDFIGKTMATETRHKRLNADAEILIKDSFTYSAQDRLLVHKQQINSLPEQLIASNTYDELGQLISKKVGGTDATGALGLQKVDYTYNIRGWLKGINDTANLINGADPKDLFSFKLSYNDTNNTAPLYNGNISETSWKTANDDVLREYFYGYDSMNRLREAWYQKGDVPLLNSYGENINYDKNGNITDLTRYGGLEDSNYPNLIDELSYDYDPQNKNQLIRVFDQSSSQQGFKDNTDGITNTTAPDYTYDANGNMITDANKGIANGSNPGIIYNHLNLPTKITFGTTGTIEYLYDAAGQKLQKKVTEGTAVTKTEYLSGFQYQNDVLQFFPHAEGYVKKVGNAYKYVFNYTDHLGNVRVSYSDSDGNGVLGNEYFQECHTNPKGMEECISYFGSPILEESNYYPFGLKHEGYSYGDQGTYKYKYNGKELQDELGLNAYDYGKRNYDPAIGRFFNMDRFAEKYTDKSPYNYAANNPIYYLDVAGDSINVSHLQNNKEGRYALKNMINDLNDITGLKFSVNSSGNLVAVDGEKDENGNLSGSSEARDYFNTIIGDKNDNIEVSIDNNSPTGAIGRGKITMNTNQIDNNIFSTESAGLGGFTYGYGFIFTHETLHTRSGTFAINSNATKLLGDDGVNGVGSVETIVNRFRSQIFVSQRNQYEWRDNNPGNSPATMQFINTSGDKTNVNKLTMPQLDKDVKRSN